MPSRNDLSSKTFIRKPGTRPLDTSIPMRTEMPPPLRQPTTRVQRAKTLTRPERSQPQQPLINPSGTSPASPAGARTQQGGLSWWRVFARLVTFWAPGVFLSACGLKDGASKQAWREKVALVFLAMLVGGFIGFITMGLNAAFCTAADASGAEDYTHVGDPTAHGTLGINGWMFTINSGENLRSPQESGVNLYMLANSVPGYDISTLFRRQTPACQGISGAFASLDPCSVALPNGQNAGCVQGDLSDDNLRASSFVNTSRKVGFGWDTVSNDTFKNFMVLDGDVLNMNPYIAKFPKPIANDPVDSIIRSQLQQMDSKYGKDATRYFYTQGNFRAEVNCLRQKYLAGQIDKITPGCFFSKLILYASLIVILGLVFIRFLMAVYFSWFISWRMTSKPKNARGRTGVALNHMPEGAMTYVNSDGTAPWASKPGGGPRIADAGAAPGKYGSSRGSSSSATLNAADIGDTPYIVNLITCYSENEEGISNTLSSLSETNYPDERKLLFVVADGMVTGSGETKSTPDVCVGLLDADARFGTPIPMSFISVAQGRKAHNMAMVYAGHYSRGRGHRTPLIIVVKCGTPEEASSAKPGNRGKRDSQMILMNFLQRVTYNDRMTPLDFDLFRKIHALMGVTPDFFELCMMVDADTKVYPESLRILSDCMMHDPLIMGACGETRIANKLSSWVTMIQVYEYFISHHLTKSFESVFGGVTCLPGCFSMYRIKARKAADDDWVPVIVKPEVTREYSQSTVTTLHQKNLLLLGEDRFLTTLLLRTFPNRKMVFCPRARCRTEVPHTFKMLLSQRRRWINSTVHNLMELVLVRDLCGTFCFSMQFIVFMDLIGTASLPVAIGLTYTLIVTYCLHPPHDFSTAIPLMLLVAVIGLPAVLILLATRKVVYVLWMLVYLLALPVWNFILPIYSFWHFDDFSWGETRKVEGEGKDTGHGDDDGTFSASSVPLRRWEDWERSRLKKLAREARRRQEFERQFGKGFYNEEKDHQDQYLDPKSQLRNSFDSSDAASDFEEDKWGAQIGGYDESQPPPPLAIVRHSVFVDGENTLVGAQDMEEMLEKGWDEDGKQGGGGWGGNDWRKENSFSPYPPMPRLPAQYGPVGNGGYRQPPSRGPPAGHYAPDGEERVALMQDRYQDGGGGDYRAHTTGVNRGASGGQQQHARNRSQPQVNPLGGDPPGGSNGYAHPSHMNNGHVDYR
ncbi:glycosyltransferase family 2 protein [Tilletiaria anomala UBC 951]|uniref:chitin synthase n=1 Tax=Tilletiaria anomala (strain ATCC 24038 / CBS 436.72 / UBC 951) TaxID=1037660 RepID=A0A066WNG2_TILAU|nr:glycosyltransferase family 2 protein [Tilletiaria anomala UBC 951]KDN52539.1 glycosyltransferase family 2 protein [Tilletiaria anomala UBC 951]